MVIQKAGLPVRLVLGPARELELRNFYALETRLKHSKSSSPISSSHPLCSREQLEQDLSKLSSPEVRALFDDEVLDHVIGLSS